MGIKDQFKDSLKLIKEQLGHGGKRYLVAPVIGGVGGAVGGVRHTSNRFDESKEMRNAYGRNKTLAKVMGGLNGGVAGLAFGTSAALGHLNSDYAKALKVKSIGKPSLRYKPPDWLGNLRTKKDVKTAFRERAAKYHPDRGGDAATFSKMKEDYDKFTKSKHFEKLSAQLGAIVKSVRKSGQTAGQATEAVKKGRSKFKKLFNKRKLKLLASHPVTVSSLKGAGFGALLGAGNAGTDADRGKKFSTNKELHKRLVNRAIVGAILGTGAGAATGVARRGADRLTRLSKNMNYRANAKIVRVEKELERREKAAVGEYKMDFGRSMRKAKHETEKERRVRNFSRPFTKPRSKRQIDLDNMGDTFRR